MMKTTRAVSALAAVAALLLSACTTGPSPVEDGQQPNKYSFTVVKTLPHDTKSFTQGLEVLSPDLMVESAGGYGTSGVRIVKISTGEVVRSADLPADQFAEGLTVVGTNVVQLTWKENVAHVWKVDDLTKASEPLTYNNEGWGLCNDKTRNLLWRSDGSDTLTAQDPKTFARKSTVSVTLQGKKVERINELECVDGYVWANVWKTNVIIKIDPKTGYVLGSLDLSDLVKDAAPKAPGPFNSDQVLNGIAYDEASKTFYVTGKQWPTMYQIKIETKEASK